MKHYDELAYYRERKKLMDIGHSKLCAEHKLANWDWLKEFKPPVVVMGDMHKNLQNYIDSMVYEG